MDPGDISNAPASSEHVETAPASFMGLPPELRLRIYDFLFGGDWVKEMKDAGRCDFKGSEKHARETTYHNDVVPAIKESTSNEGQDDSEGATSAEDRRPPDEARMHCCSPFLDLTNKPNGPVRQTTCICCLNRLHPAILSTNRLVYNEALPIFYSWVEPRISLPVIASSQDHPAEGVHAILEAFPKECVQFITRVVLVEKIDVMGICINYDSLVDGFEELFDAIESSLPNIKHIRVHIDLEEAFPMANFPCVELEGAIRLPKLRTVEVELACTEFREPSEFINDEGEKLVDLQDIVLTSLSKEAERLGKRVEVSVS